MGADASTVWSSLVALPAVVTLPATSMMSFSPSGMPNISGSASAAPAAIAARSFSVAAAAAARASSAYTAWKDLRLPSTLSHCARHASTASVGVSVPARYAAASSLTPSSWGARAGVPMAVRETRS